MRNLILNTSNDIKMTMSHMDACGESRIEKMRKFLSSPLTRKKPNGTHTKTFGTSLDILVQRSSSQVPIPFVVTRICQYIEHGGLMHEGVFRISGNARLIERLKTCFDQTGDAPLETEGDVASAAALLKLFFRELPDPVIPLSMHQQFLNSVKGSDRDKSIAELAVLVEKLPLANFSVLKYLSYFLTSVCKFEAHNRMSASSLGIVFGPNLFRVTDDFVGLKEQSLTNQIVTYFITDYYAIFHDDPPNYRKSFTSAMETNTKQSKLSTTDSMVASWPKLSALPSLTSSLNLRPLSVSIPTMGRSNYPIGPYAESLANKEHILVVDEVLPMEDSISSEQTLTYSENEKCNKEISNVSEVEPDDEEKEDTMSSESRTYWKDFYFVDDVDDVVDPQNLSHEAYGIQNDPNDDIDHTCLTDESFYPDETMTSVTLHDEEKHHVNPTSSKLANDCFSLEESNSNSPLVSVNMYQDDDILLDESINVSKPCQENIHSHPVYDRNVKHLVDDQNIIVSKPIQDNLEFAADLYRPAGEKRFGRNHKHHQRLAHRAYHYKKQNPVDEESRSFPFLHEISPELEDIVPQSVDTELSHLENECLQPPTDLAVTSNTYYSASSPTFDDKYGWPASNSFQDEQIEQISPARQFLKLSGNSEAPLSPSAYRSYLSHRNPHLDPNLPPSPPVEQEDLATGPICDVNKAAAKLLSKRIQSLKKKVKKFEESFEASRSYRPSQAEKSQHPEIKKLMEELNQARQDLKQLKDEQTLNDISPSQSWYRTPDTLSVPVQKYNKSTNTTQHNFILKDNTAASIEESLKQALEYLAEKRRISQRSELLEEMSKEQLFDEKLCIQKLLLQFESIHGRPSTKAHRDIMRPLYDRYRSAKRILARSASFGSASKIKDAVELQPILEHETMDFKSTATKDSTAKIEECAVASNIEKNENEVVKEMNCEPVPTVSIERDPDYDDQVKYSEARKSGPHLNLHELSLPELYEQQQQARAEKRKLRRILREFEYEFQKENGRKVQREDKLEMESTYSAYKHVRARLKLLEALAAKHGYKNK